jgi:hypothetical protein
MSGDADMLAALESFVEDVVRIRGLGEPDAGDLARKVDVLERVVELMRLRSGVMENRLRMEELLGRGLQVSRGGDGAVRLLVGGGAVTGRAGWRSRGGRTQTEMQVPLILYLLITYRSPRTINNLLVDFLSEARAWLSPSDVETTRTGVMRAMTTTRSAARALRLHGLLTDSDRTAYKTWELSVLGLLVGALLLERFGPTLDMNARALRARRRRTIWREHPSRHARQRGPAPAERPERGVSRASYGLRPESRCLRDVRPSRGHRGGVQPPLPHRREAAASRAA